MIFNFPYGNEHISNTMYCNISKCFQLQVPVFYLNQGHRIVLSYQIV